MIRLAHILPLHFRVSVFSISAFTSGLTISRLNRIPQSQTLNPPTNLPPPLPRPFPESPITNPQSPISLPNPMLCPIDIILNENPVPIRERMPGLQKEIASIIDKSLLRNPKARFADAGKLLGSLSKRKP